MHKGIYKTGKSTIKYKNIFLLNRSNSDSLVIFFIQNESIQLVYEYCALKLYILNVCLLGWIILEWQQKHYKYYCFPPLFLNNILTQHN